MLLSRKAILNHKEKGNIIIDPYNPKNLKTVSYDISLGEWFWRESHPGGRGTVHNMYEEESTRKIWIGPYQAELASAAAERFGRELKNIKSSDKIILLGPGETILGHTIEYIGGRNVVVAKMYSRSSLGRNFIEVCKDAGWGDVGYFNRWTMEITNNSKHYSIPLVVGRRIGQMVFYEVAPLDGGKNDYVAEAGKYQVSNDLEELKKNWNPEMMIPQMHKDWEVRE